MVQIQYHIEESKYDWSHALFLGVVCNNIFQFILCHTYRYIDRVGMFFFLSDKELVTLSR